MFTKTSVTILIGSPPEVEGGSYFVKVLNSGKTLDGRDFHDWDRAGFKANVLHQFVHFLSQTSGELFLFIAITLTHSTLSRYRMLPQRHNRP
jgi:hypothetical protein